MLHIDWFVAENILVFLDDLGQNEDGVFEEKIRMSQIGERKKKAGTVVTVERTFSL
ncbi:MAG: hypothetical protein IPJ60_19255 [Sphingobacteriaceae bacterium]|nr:hypothetical protein [Sphingobacteriaceae bacterium]